MLELEPDREVASRSRLLAQLRRDDDPDAAALADVLDACCTTRPCQSAACPVCGVTSQQAAVQLVNEMIREPAREIRNRTHALTIVPAIGCVAPDELTVRRFELVAAEVLAVFENLDLPPAVIGLEASFNEDLTGRVPDHVCVHSHSIGLDWLSPLQDAGLRAAFPPSRWVKHPTRNDPLDHDVRARRYPFKAERFRRVTYWNTSDPERGPYRDTKHRALRPKQAVRLALVEHQLGFGRRLLTHKIDEDAVRRLLEPCGWVRQAC